MNRRRLLRLSFLRVALAALLWPVFASAHAQTAATVTEIAGMVVETDAAGRSRVLAMDSSVASGSVLRTATDSHVRLKFGDGTALLLRPNTEFSVRGFRFEQARPDTDSFAVRLIKGGFRQVTGLIGKRSPHAIDIRAANATIGIRGTDFAVRMCDADCGGDNEAQPPNAGVYVQVHDGAVSLAQAGAEVVLVKGEVGFADAKNTPPQRIDSTPPLLRQDKLLGRASLATGCTP